MATQLSVQVATNQVRLRVLAYAERLWGALPSYRQADVDRFIERVVPRVLAGQMQVANLTAAYLRDQLGHFAPVDQAHVTGGRGVPPTDVYRRPAIASYTALSKGETTTAAIAAGAHRLASLVSMDLQMAKVRQAQRSLEGAGASAYRRVLTGREDCALCVIASTQVYSKSDLMPIHPGCDCGIQPVSADWNPRDQVLGADLLKATHEAIARHTGRDSDSGARDLGVGKTDSKGRPLSDYTNLLITREHGEYGPTLAWRDEHFTSKADIPALN